MKKYYIITLLLALCMLSHSASAQEDVIKTVPDKGTSGMFFAKLCPKTDVAINKDDADVFSVYTDGETARFAQLRIRKGKYVIKAGECAIIKTPEEKEIKLESTTAQSSIIWTDLISPSTDTSLEDFKKEHKVAEGQYIYMLTNLERNGGFGFTHFGGKTLKAGNFYIINTRKPSGSTGITMPIANKEEGDIYNLKGEKVKDPKKPGIYVRNGKKFIVK